MKKTNNKKGFTLAELLVVVAIIAVLVAISIPIFTSQLEKSREATDLANIRAAYAEATANALDSKDNTGSATTPKMVSTGTFEKVDISEITWTDLSKLSIEKGAEYTVSVSESNGKSTATITKKVNTPANTESGE